MFNIRSVINKRGSTVHTKIIGVFRLVMSFEAITANLVNQENFTALEKVGEDITIKAERVRVHFL